MNVQGIVVAGTATTARPQMTAFLADVLGLRSELAAAGVPVDEQVSSNARERYAHVTAPDGQLHELVERRSG